MGHGDTCRNLQLAPINHFLFGDLCVSFEPNAKRFGPEQVRWSFRSKPQQKYASDCENDGASQSGCDKSHPKAR